MNVVTPNTLKKNENRRGIMGLFSKKPSPQSAKMISLLNGEVARKSFDVKKSKRGKGAFHVTNYRIIFETLKDGVYISPDWYHLRSVHAIKKDKILIVWDDDNGRRWRFELKFGIPAEQVVQEVETANIEWSRDHDMTEEQARKEFNKRKGILVDNEISKDEADEIRQKRAEKFELEYVKVEKELEELKKELDNYPNNLDYKEQRGKIWNLIDAKKKEILIAKSNVDGIKEMRMLRDPRIPQKISNEDCWNNCYHDKNWKGYVTFDEEILEKARPEAKDSELNKKFQKEVNNGGLIFAEEGTIFYEGYPARFNASHQPIILATIE